MIANWLYDEMKEALGDRQTVRYTVVAGSEVLTRLISVAFSLSFYTIFFSSWSTSYDILSLAAIVPDW